MTKLFPVLAEMAGNGGFKTPYFWGAFVFLKAQFE